MKHRLLTVLFLSFAFMANAQVNTDHMMRVGKNALYFSDYVLAIKYFNMVIGAKPYMAEAYGLRAMAKYVLGDYAGAEKDCSAALALNPFITLNYETRSLSRIRQEKYGEAIEDYKAALKIRPDVLDLWRNFAVCSKEVGDYEGAMSILDTLRSKAPNYTFTLHFRSELHLEVGDTLAAIADLDTLLSIDKYDHAAYMSRAIINLGKKRYDEVERDLTYAIKLSPQSGHYINRAIAREEQDNLIGAMKDLDMAIELEPDNALAHMNRGLLREKVGDYNRAIEDYTFVLECVPDHIRARYARAMLLRRTGDWQGVVDDLTKLIEEFPKFADGYKMRSEMYRNMGLYAQASEDEMMALKVDELARWVSMGGKEEPSKEELEKQKRIKEVDDLNNYKKKQEAKNPEYVYVQEFSSEHRGLIQHKDVYVELRPLYALTYYKQRSEVDGVVHYHRELEMMHHELPLPLLVTASEQALDEQQIAFHFKDIDMQTHRLGEGDQEGFIYLARGLDFYLVQDLMAAIDDFTQSIVADGALWMSYFCRAVARYKQMESDRNGRGVSSEEQKTATMPNDFLVDSRLNDYQLILADLNKAIDLAPDFAYSYYNRGNVLSQLKDYRAAIVSYDEAIALEPNLAEAYYNRGLTYIFIGENARGIADLSKAGELGLYSAYNLIKRFAE